MKIADVIGLGAAVTAGFYAGYQGSQKGFDALAWTDYLVIFGLLAVAFYFAVILS